MRGRPGSVCLVVAQHAVVVLRFKEQLVFGLFLGQSDKHILEQYELAHNWESDGEGGFRNTGVPKGSGWPAPHLDTSF